MKYTYLLTLTPFFALVIGGCTSPQRPPASTRSVHASQQAVATLPPAPVTKPSRLPSLLPSFTATLTVPPIASITPTATALSCWAQAGGIESGQLRSDLLPLPLEFRIYTPPCYAELRDSSYPVLYLVHGQSYTEDQWIRLGVAETADALIAAREVPPFIIVMPRDRVWTQPNEDMFGQAVIHDLIPWIDENYRTLSQRAFRAIGGLSRGGGWAVHLGLSQWETFAVIGAHSLAVFDLDAPYYINTWLDSIPFDSMPRIYLDIGDRDREVIMRSAVWFSETLDERGIPHEWRLYSGFHEESYWEAHLEEYLRWYSQEW